MTTRDCLVRIINAFQEQGFLISKGVNVYYNAPERLQSVSDCFVEPLPLSRFQGDMYVISNDLQEIVLFPWVYSKPKPIFHSILGETQAVLAIVGIVLVPNWSECDLQSVFKRFDKVVLNVLRKYPRCVEKKATYGTLMCLFEHTEDAQRFNKTIRKYYASHIFKNTITSAISIDCEAGTLTQGKAGVWGFRWQGGIRVLKLKNAISADSLSSCPSGEVKDIVEEVFEESDAVEMLKSAIRISMLISEMEKAINQIVPESCFKYPEAYYEYDGNVGVIGWSFIKGATFISEQLEYLKNAFGVRNLIPFAIDTVDDSKEPTQYACFLIDGISNSHVVIVYPFGTKESFWQEDYESLDEWFDAESENLKLKRI